MGLFDKFINKKKDQLDPINDLTLSKLKLGYLLDYDMKTWEVSACNHYNWGDGDITYEWQLKSASETMYLEREVDDENYWSISQPIQIGQINQNIIKNIMEHNEPPDEIIYNNTTYYMNEFGSGYFHKDRGEHEKELLRWDYINKSGNDIFTIEQWGEKDFQAFRGKIVEEYQFTNILPSETKSV